MIGAKIIGRQIGDFLATPIVIGQTAKARVVKYLDKQNKNSFYIL